MKVGFLVMGLPMAKNLVKKAGCEILGFDVVEKQREAFATAGGTAVSDAEEIYKTCDVIMQILPTHAIIRDSVEKAIRFGKPGRIIVDLSSTAPDIIQEMYQDAKKAGMFLLDSPISGGNPMAIAGTLAIMTGGDKEAFEQVKPLLECMGHPVYTGGAASPSSSTTSWRVRTWSSLPRRMPSRPRPASTCRQPLRPPAAVLPAVRSMTTRCPS